MSVSVKVFDMSGKETGSIELDENIFGIEVNMHVMHQAVVQYLANQRQGTKSAKTRAEVRGGGRKPWRQKGTGRARQGSIRSPQWRGGGVVFAPKPRDFSIKLNKKVKRLALKSALTTRVQDEKLIVLEELNLPQIKTKEMQKVFNNLNITKGLVVLEEGNLNVILSTRNIPNIKTSAVNTINVHDILKYETFIVTKKALEKIQEVYK